MSVTCPSHEWFCLKKVEPITKEPPGPSIPELLERLGFPRVGNGNIDEAFRWALVELALRREQENVGSFLRFLDADIARGNVQPIDPAWVERMRELVKGVEVDLDAEITDDPVCCGCGRAEPEHFDPCVCIRCVSSVRPSPDSPEICAACLRDMERT